MTVEKEGNVTRIKQKGVRLFVIFDQCSVGFGGILIYGCVTTIGSTLNTIIEDGST